MAQLKKFKLFIICAILAFLGYILFTPTNLSSHKTLGSYNAKENKHKKSRISSNSFLSTHFTVPPQFKNIAYNNDIRHFPAKTDFTHYSQQTVESVSDHLIGTKKSYRPNNYTMNFTEFPVNGSISNHSGNESTYDNSNNIQIDDELYLKNNPNNTITNSNNEIVFISDDLTNKLVSCNENNTGAYTCHTALSNLNRPQDILVINNYIYIINQHQDKESGDVTRCSINSAGYIDGCGQTKIDLINPIFFYYNPPYIYISDFVYAGSKRIKPYQAIRCTIAKNGDFTDCNWDYDSISMSYISKYYNNSYYRTYSDQIKPAIQKCTTVDSKSCTHLTNKLLVYPLSININHDRIFITNDKPGSAISEVLKCNMDLTTCSIITKNIESPMCIGVYDLVRPDTNNVVNL